MGKELFENFAVARQVFEEADDALGFAISRLCFDGPAEELQLTENTQPAILTVSVAAFRAMMDRQSDPTLPACHLTIAPRLVVRDSCGAYLPRTQGRKS